LSQIRVNMLAQIHMPSTRKKIGKTFV